MVFFFSIFGQVEVFLAMYCFSADELPWKLYNISNNLGRCGGVVIAQA